METITLTAVPETEEGMDINTVYKIVPKHFNSEHYWERVDRNMGWHSTEEQRLISLSKGAFAGCGGMGGHTIERMVRLGMLELKLSDNQTFDRSNINRQFAAKETTLGKSKLLETARQCLEVSPDVTLWLYPGGIHEGNVAHFVQGTDVVCDEIEFFAVGSRILLHTEIRKNNVTTFTCPTVGHAVYITKFNAYSMRMEDVLEMEYEEAKLLQSLLESRSFNKAQLDKVLSGMLRLVAPELPEYSVDTHIFSTVQSAKKRLAELTAPIIATNPLMAAGFLSNHVYFELLTQKSAVKRNFVLPPLMPGYSMYDCALNKAERFEGQWW